MGRRRIELAAADLGKHCRGELILASRELEPYSRDFGGMVRRLPSAVLRPLTVDDAVTALKIAVDHEVPVTTRGSGHSQAGQCLGDGLVLDMRSLGRVIGVSTGDDVIEVEAGAQWRAVVDASFSEGKLPRGLRHVLDTTVAGTLSVAGVGSESWSTGAQVDNVAYLDIATLDGKIQRASAHENCDLFDAVRGGLGQIGVILRVGYPLRKCGRRVRSRYFVYSSVDRFMDAVETVCLRPDGLLFGALTRSARERRWVLLLVIGSEYENRQSDTNRRTFKLDFDEELPEQDAPIWNETGVPGHLFFRLHAPNPSSLDADPSTLHPWVEHIFSRNSAHGVLETLMSDHSGMLGLGTNGIIMVRRNSSPAPLFSTPAGADLLWGIGMFPSIAPWFSDDAQNLMTAHAAQGRAANGKRYLSGFVQPMDEASWREHYGSEAWEFFRRVKAEFDPNHRLNAGFISWT